MAEPVVVGKIAIRVMPDTKHFRSDLRNELRPIEATLKDLKIRLSLDRQAVADLRRDLRRFADQVSPIEVKVRPELLTGSTTAIRTRLQVLTRPRTVEIVPRLNGGAYGTVLTALAALSGARGAWTWIDAIGRALRDIDKNLPAIAAMGLAIAGLVGWLGAATANLASLSAELARIAPLALVLPGVFTGVALGVGATVAVLRDFNRMLPEVGSQLSSLQDQMSGAFWARALDPMREDFSALLPEFSQGMTATSAMLGSFFASLASALETSLGGGVASGMFADLARSIAVAEGGTRAWAETIRVLGEVGAGYLPRLAGWFVDLSNRFGRFLTDAQASGALDAWIERAITNLGHLGDVLASIGSIFAGIARAAEAAGSSTLASLAARLEGIAQAVNASGFQRSLSGFFQGAHDMMSAIGQSAGDSVAYMFERLAHTAQTVLPIAGRAIGLLVDAIADLASHPAVQTGLEAIFTGLQTGISLLGQDTNQIAAGLGGLLQVAGDLALALGGILGPALGTLGQVVAILAPAVSELIGVLGEGLVAAWQALAPLIIQVTGYLAELVSALPLADLTALVVDVLTPLADALMALMAVIGPIAVEWLPKLVSAALSLTEAFLPLYEVLLQVATVVLAPLLEVALPAAIDLLILLANELAGLAEQYLPSLVAGLEAALPYLYSLGEVVGHTLVLAFEIIGAAITAVISILNGLIDFLYGAFTGDWELAWSGIVEIFRGVFVDLLKGIMDAFWHWLVALIGEATQAIWNSITAWVSDLAAEFERGALLLTMWALHIRDQVTARFFELVDGVVAKIVSFPDWLGAQLQRGTDLMMAAATSARILIPGEMGEMVADAIERVASLPGRAQDALSGIGSTLVDAGRRLIDGLIDGIEAKIGEVQSTLSTLTAMLPEWKGPAAKDRTILVGAGRLVIDGFRSAMESRYASVRASLRSFSAQIARTEIPAPMVSDMTARSSLAIDQAQNESGTEGARGSRVLNYYAAPQASMSSEEALFAAASRSARMGW